MTQCIVEIAISAVVAEFGLHVVYHAITGKAGLYDPPFEYLKDIWSMLGKRRDKKRLDTDSPNVF